MLKTISIKTIDALGKIPNIRVNSMEIHRLIPSKMNNTTEKEICITIKYKEDVTNN